ncbi:hypothetical protein F1529_04280 [Alcanivorax sp. VBW004]|uniref:hypothetical protein n=1 Tax=Alcanivorax sp. VBW004 TaxID=1287708 RepID=UPI0012BB63E7|nr:hypothetical protein [Alcanivorax sp. VBW004]MTT51698.1 hypothetical protein [Alcanivorax sp. VBW004]
MSPPIKPETPQRERIRPLPSLLVLIVVTASLWGFVYILAKHVHPHGSSVCPQQCQSSEQHRSKT